MINVHFYSSLFDIKIKQLRSNVFYDFKLRCHQVLSDAEKRRQYDLYGPEVASSGSSGRRGRSGFYEHDPSHGFESDMTAEEIFNMFFGGGFPSQTVYVRRGGGDPTGRFRSSAHSHRTYHSHQSAESREVNCV